MGIKREMRSKKGKGASGGEVNAGIGADLFGFALGFSIGNEWIATK